MKDTSLMIKPVEFFQVVDLTVIVLNILVASSQSEKIVVRGIKRGF